MTRTVDELIERLKEIRIEESAVIEELTEARKLENRNHTDTNNAAHVNNRQKQQNNDNTIKVGSRVKITNKVRAPFGRQLSTTEDGLATVYKVNGERVYFVTDKGYKTWRNARNLKKIE